MESTVCGALHIDKNGVWYYRGAEMIRKEIVLLFARNLRRTLTGEYLVQLNGEQCTVDVEDTPFVVKNASLIHSAGRDFFSIELTDESVEELNLESLRISQANILYSTVKGGTFEARFSRPAYYQLTAFMEHDPRGDRYFLAVNGCTHYIQPLPGQSLPGERAPERTDPAVPNRVGDQRFKKND